MSDRFLVDTSRGADPAAALSDLLALSRIGSWRGSAGDLAWTRLEPWREAVASFFDSPLTRRHLEGISRVAVKGGGPAARDGGTVAGAYLAGWLASRLGWTRDPSPWTWKRGDGTEVRVEAARDRSAPPGGIVAIRIDAPDVEPPARFSAERIAAGSAIVRLAVEIEGTCPLPASLRIGEPDEAALLCRELERTSADPLLSPALREAAGAVAG
jgi:glucose-6-phosphate dehydrogenase assembly protein OpcA